MPFLSPLKTRLTVLRIAGLALAASLGAISSAKAALTANDGFDPNANSNVNAIALQPDGKILMGGYFTQLHPLGGPVSGNAYIARLNHDGSVDTGFTAGTDNVVRTVVLQPNGQILVGGTFSKVKPTGSANSVTRNFAARLNADGTLDTTFNPNANGVVYAMAYQPNGQVIIGGSFTTLQPNGAASATGRSCAARINSDGSLDAGFDPEPNGSVSNILILPNAQIVLG